MSIYVKLPPMKKLILTDLAEIDGVSRRYRISHKDAAWLLITTDEEERKANLKRFEELKASNPERESDSSFEHYKELLDKKRYSFYPISTPFTVIPKQK